MDNFANNDNSDGFQELLNSLPTLAPVVPGKRGGGRKASNNIGADVLGVEMLKELRTNHHVNLFGGDLKGNTLWGVVDQKSYDRAKQISMSIAPSYPQTGILSVSLTQTTEGNIVVQWWKATSINGVLSFRKFYRKGAEYALMKNQKGDYGIWKIDSSTGNPEVKNNGDYFSFPYGELVDFEDYLNSIVEVTELPVSFPDEEVSKLKGLSEILASVNINTVVDSTDDSDEEFEEEEDEVGA